MFTVFLSFFFLCLSFCFTFYFNVSLLSVSAGVSPVKACAHAYHSGSQEARVSALLRDASCPCTLSLKLVMPSFEHIYTCPGGSIPAEADPLLYTTLPVNLILILYLFILLRHEA